MCLILNIIDTFNVFWGFSGTLVMMNVTQKQKGKVVIWQCEKKQNNICP